MKDIHARAPVDSTAARVTSGGVHYVPKRNAASMSSDVPLPVRVLDASILKNPAFPRELVGAKVGQLTVLGLSVKSDRWVCRCSCGYYVERKAKALRNPHHAASSRCDRCDHVQKLKDRATFIATGSYPDRGTEQTA